jgi:hypothetical protein
MSDDDDMVEHESGDAGASLEYPLEAGQVKKNGHIIMKGDKPCKVSRSPSRGLGTGSAHTAAPPVGDRYQGLEDR